MRYVIWQAMSEIIIHQNLWFIFNCTFAHLCIFITSEKPAFLPASNVVQLELRIWKKTKLITDKLELLEMQ